MVARENYLSENPQQVTYNTATAISLEKRPSERISEFVSETAVVLDCGSGLRENQDAVRKIALRVHTLDVYDYGSYPDIFFDLTSDSLPDALTNRFDVVFCFSILEHVQNPILAGQNLQGMLKENGLIVGYVPWLFPYHSGRGMPNERDQGFGDYWRFSADSLKCLFPAAKRIEVYPVRNQSASAILLALFRNGRNFWKALEHKFPVIRKYSATAHAGHGVWQSSGYEFVVSF